MRTLRLVAICAVAAVVGSACSNDGSGSASAEDYGDATFESVGSIGQAFLKSGESGAKIELVDSEGQQLATGTVDEMGSLIFREVPPGDGYQLRTIDENPVKGDDFEVFNAENSLPSEDFYTDQRIEEGFGYIETRDGTLLSASTFLPPGDGPFPTVVEYSGYDPSNPTQDLLSALEPLNLDISICETVKIICKTPAQPSSLLAAAMGYAVVAVNVRGTGCSGGAYDFFDEPQRLDGYDVIEAVAAQDWVRNDRVGMVGLSYPGISQLFVASTQPPSLAAIAPQSVFDDSARGVLAPGGVFNEGFALEWTRQVLGNAEPYGQGWEQEVVDKGDQTCAENQEMRGQNVDVIGKALGERYYDPEVAGPLDPSAFVDRIDVPVYMTGSWQDEQTGPRFTNLWTKFDNSPYTRFTAFNGAHADGYSPEDLVEWKLFLDMFVAGERTPLPTFLEIFGPGLVGDTFKAETPFPEERLLEGDFEDLKTFYLAEDPVTIRWERGSSDPLGAPLEAARTTFPSWPPPGQTASRWYLHNDGSLSPDAPTDAEGASRFITNPELAGKTTLPGDLGGQAFWAEPEWDWDYYEADDAMTFVSPPLPEDMVILGPGRADLWIRSSETGADIGITLSEVRPDGNEQYVQSGILRAEMRAPGPDETELFIDGRGFEEDAEPLVPDEWTEASIEIMPVGHIFRAGSRVAFTVHSPGGDKTRWSWILDDFDDPPVVSIGHNADHPSSIALPMVPRIDGYPEALSPCPSLRGQPCRPFEEFTNTSAE